MKKKIGHWLIKWLKKIVLNEEGCAMDMNRKKNEMGKEKNPYDRRSEVVTKKAFKSVEKGVKPVAKDTNKTRRKITKARIVGETVKKEKPISHLKKDMKRPIKTK
jgi:hypothetical protein